MNIRWNIIALAIIGAVAVLTLAFGVDDTSAVIAAGAGLIGGISAVMSKLAEPEPPPPDPSVPASVVIAMLERYPECGLSDTLLAAPENADGETGQ